MKYEHPVYLYKDAEEMVKVVIIDSSALDGRTELDSDGAGRSLIALSDRHDSDVCHATYADSYDDTAYYDDGCLERIESGRMTNFENDQHKVLCFGTPDELD